MVHVYTFYHILESIVRRWIWPKAEKDIQGGIALVTGAGRGIGRELAFQLANKRVKVVCWDLDPNTCAETAEIIRENGGEAWSVQCDVSDREAVAEAAKETRKLLGSQTITMLFNNAGIMPCKPFLSHTPQEIERTFGVNVYSQMWTLFEFIADLMKAPNGANIVSMSSTAGMTGVTNVSVYSATKFAVRGLMESLVLEFRELYPNCGLTITRVHPFVVNTGLAKKPATRFASMIPFTDADEAARIIIQAMRRDEPYIFVPTHLDFLLHMMSILPHKVWLLAHDFWGCKLGAHD